MFWAQILNEAKAKTSTSDKQPMIDSDRVKVENQIPVDHRSVIHVLVAIFFDLDRIIMRWLSGEISHQALLLEVFYRLQDGEIILGGIVENETLSESHLATICFLVLQSLIANLLIVDEATLALLAACTTGRKVLAMSLKLCLWWLSNANWTIAAG